jgi:hypothetical protein
MGNLVFQAALGGTVTLVGPNTAATTSLTLPSVDGSSGQALTTNGSGTLAFSTLGVAGGGTGITSAPSNGQLLIGNGTNFTASTLTAGSGVSISNGAGSITISSSGSGAFGTDLSFVDYSLTLASAIGGPGVVRMQAVSLDGTSELMILQGTSSAHAVIWNSSTNTFGTPVLVRTAALSTVQNIALAKVSSTSVLVCSLVSTATALETVVLTVSGSTITVNTAVATTLSANSTFIATNTRLVTVGSSYVLNYYNTTGTTPKFRAITVSGTTPSIGSELAYAGPTTVGMHHSYAYNSTTLLYIGTTSTTLYANPITVSGTTLTAGTAATVGSTTNANICTGVLSTGRVAVCYFSSSGVVSGALISVVGSVASITAAATTIAASSGVSLQMQVFSNQAFFTGSNAAANEISVLTDTAGVPTVGTPITNTGNFVGFLSTGKIFIATTTAGNSAYNQFGISSGAAVLEKTFDTTTSTTVVTAEVPNIAPYSNPLSGIPQSASNKPTLLRTSSGKSAVATSSVQPFAVSIDGTNPPKLQQTANPFTAFNDAIDTAIAWGLPTTQSTTTTTVQLRKVTLA